MRFVEL